MRMSHRTHMTQPASKLNYSSYTIDRSFTSGYHFRTFRTEELIKFSCAKLF